MKFKKYFLRDYMCQAPLALAFERVMECRILAQMEFARPILDIGCGEGLFAAMLFDENIDTGIDPDAGELQRAEQLQMYDELICCTGDNIPKEDGYYRTVFSNSVLEHIDDLEPVLREAHRLLAPGGRFYATVPSDNFDRFTIGYQLLRRIGLRAAAERFAAFFNRFWQHYHYHAPAQWQQVMTAAGFEVVEIRTYGPQRVCVVNDLLTPVSLVELLTKKLFNRWTLLPAVRRFVLYPVFLGARRFLSGAENATPGGLVFLALTKR